ncbi:YitT family protein [Treponema sp. R80B11-R83G3]
MNNKILSVFRRLFLVTLAGVLMSINIKTFVHAGELIPGGFTGLSLLLQKICLRFGNFNLPFSLPYYILNSVPAIISFKFIGKKFTLYSLITIVITGILADSMPSMFIEAIKVHDTLLSAVFGGALNGLGIALCLYADATSGGSDFIAIFISERYRKDAWNYIFIANCVILAVAGALFGLDKALYSIIFQFTTTVALETLYRNYQQRTLLIITNKPDVIFSVINEKTHHGATCFEGFGSYEKKSRTLLYSVVTASQVKTLIPAIRQIDEKAFINVLKTDQLNGRFYQKPFD